MKHPPQDPRTPVDVPLFLPSSSYMLGVTELVYVSPDGKFVVSLQYVALGDWMYLKNVSYRSTVWEEQGGAP